MGANPTIYDLLEQGKITKKECEFLYESIGQNTEILWFGRTSPRLVRGLLLMSIMIALVSAGHMYLAHTEGENILVPAIGGGLLVGFLIIFLILMARSKNLTPSVYLTPTHLFYLHPRLRHGFDGLSNLAGFKRSLAMYPIGPNSVMEIKGPKAAPVIVIKSHDHYANPNKGNQQLKIRFVAGAPQLEEAFYLAVANL